MNNWPTPPPDMTRDELVDAMRKASGPNTCYSTQNYLDELRHRDIAAAAESSSRAARWSAIGACASAVTAVVALVASVVIALTPSSPSTTTPSPTVPTAGVPSR